MLINNWYVAATENEIKADKPYRVKMLGQWFALYRSTADEDTAVVQDVNPRYLPRNMSDELLVESDQNEARFRRLVHKLARRGWEIDIDEAARLGRYRTLAIPCPRRRKDPRNWIAQPVPTTFPRRIRTC